MGSARAWIRSATFRFAESGSTANVATHIRSVRGGAGSDQVIGAEASGRPGSCRLRAVAACARIRPCVVPLRGVWRATSTWERTFLPLKRTAGRRSELWRGIRGGWRLH